MACQGCATRKAAIVKLARRVVQAVTPKPKPAPKA
jgi:hypothetical protein